MNGGRAFSPDLFKAFDVPVRRLVSDSRQVAPGDVFVAYPGDTVDGRGFIPGALERGAAAVLWEPHGFQWAPGWNVPNIAVPALRERIGLIAEEFFGRPSEALWMVGITGTNGKTSCSQWVASAMSHCGRKTAVVGTLGNGFPGHLESATHTTPDPISLHANLARFRDEGASAVAMEVSSHGLAQGRVNGVRFNVAVLTNLSRDHLDYHGTMERYAEAKARLFDWDGLDYAVLNADDPFGQQLSNRLKGASAKSVLYGIERGEVRAEQMRVTHEGLEFAVHTPWGAGVVSSRMLGGFNASNLLAVLSVLLVSGLSLDESLVALKRLESVPGRLERLGGDGLPLVVVDYAHTPDALEKVLETLREIVATTQGGRLLCVFGCGGNRDKGKRPLMGELATRIADTVILTSDNPRSEDPRQIIEDIIQGMHANYHVEEDRAAAIFRAVREARPDDVVLIAGKGHEAYQDIGGEKLPFSDREVALRALQERKANDEAQ